MVRINVWMDKWHVVMLKVRGERSVGQLEPQWALDRFKIRDLSQKYRYRVESHAFDHEEFKYDIYFALRPREPFPQRT